MSGQTFADLPVGLLCRTRALDIALACDTRLARKARACIHTVMIRVSQIAALHLQLSGRSGGQTFAHRDEWMGCSSYEARTPGGIPGLVLTA